MPSPITPNQVKETVPSASGSFCEKFLNLLKLPRFVYLIVSYLFKEDGTIGTDFAADICALNCGTGTDGTGGGPAGVLQPPTNVEASDGSKLTSIVITWTASAGATSYDLYRSTTNNSATATKIVESIEGTSYEDTTVTPATYYYYWLKAKNTAQTSAFSLGNQGHAGSMSTTINAVSDLTATKGVFPRGKIVNNVMSGSFIALTWSKVTGADRYTIYRNTVDEFSTAQAIDVDREPFLYQNGSYFGSDGKQIFVDHGDGKLMYQDWVPNRTTTYYYWVRAKRTTGLPGESNPSNSGTGASGFGAYGDARPVSSTGALTVGVPFAIPAGIASVWVAIYGMGGGGAGGGTTYGGGGGGGGDIITGKFNVASGSKIRISKDPNTSMGNAAAETGGENGRALRLEYSADGTFNPDTTVLLLVCDRAGGGQYSASSNGAGGVPPAGSNVQDTGLFVTGQIYPGTEGEAANGINGGRGGYAVGHYKTNAAHYDSHNPLSGSTGQGGVCGGGGSKGSPTATSFATGGKCVDPNSYIVLCATPV